MAKENAPPKDEPPAGPGEWIVTFSDCMTLLLCFFVLLLTFSSFDEESLRRFGGAFISDQLRPGIEVKPRHNDSLVEPTEGIDRSMTGAEFPNDNTHRPADRETPESHWLPEQDAYRDRKIIHIPSSRLFVRGSDLSDRGRNTLNVVAEFLAEMPCRVIVSESTRRWTTKGGTVIGRRAGLNRAWAVVAHLTGTRRPAGPPLARERFSISTFQQARPVSASRGPVVEIVMLSGRAHR